MNNILDKKNLKIKICETTENDYVKHGFICKTCDDRYECKYDKRYECPRFIIIANA